VLSTPPAFVLSQNQTLQTKTTRQNQVHRKSEKSDIQQPVKTGKKNKTIPTAGRREVPHQDGQKQQTKTTKHTIEFSNNTPHLLA
jgi:hypothetical protein